MGPSTSKPARSIVSNTLWDDAYKSIQNSPGMVSLMIDLTLLDTTEVMQTWDRSFLLALRKEKEDLETNLQELMNKTIKEIWLSELKLFEKNYKKMINS